MQRPGRNLVIALAGALLLSGCAAAPTFRVEHVSITTETDEGMVLEFTILGENRRDTPIPLREVRYQLVLGGTKVFEGSRSPEATIQRYGSQSFTVPVAVDRAIWTGEADGLTTYRFNATVYYQKPGSLAELLFETEIRRPHVSFVERGQLDFGDAPDQAIPDSGTPSDSGP